MSRRVVAASSPPGCPGAPRDGVPPGVDGAPVGARPPPRRASAGVPGMGSVPSSRDPWGAPATRDGSEPGRALVVIQRAVRSVPAARPPRRGWRPHRPRSRRRRDRRRPPPRRCARRCRRGRSAHRAGPAGRDRSASGRPGRPGRSGPADPHLADPVPADPHLLTRTLRTRTLLTRTLRTLSLGPRPDGDRARVLLRTAPAGLDRGHGRARRGCRTGRRRGRRLRGALSRARGVGSRGEPGGRRTRRGRSGRPRRTWTRQERRRSGVGSPAPA